MSTGMTVWLVWSSSRSGSVDCAVTGEFGTVLAVSVLVRSGVGFQLARKAFGSRSRASDRRRARWVGELHWLLAGVGRGSG
jgi:hypothetical protein